MTIHDHFACHLLIAPSHSKEIRVSQNNLRAYMVYLLGTAPSGLWRVLIGKHERYGYLSPHLDVSTQPCTLFQTIQTCQIYSLSYNNITALICRKNVVHKKLF